jgi:hypothetical protein
MTSIADLLTGAEGFTMDSLTPLLRYRMERKTDPYNPAATIGSGFGKPLKFNGFIASASSTQSQDGARETTDSTAVLTIPDPAADIHVGDEITLDPDDGRRWRVNGFPSHEANPFTAWNPTLECALEEVRG